MAICAAGSMLGLTRERVEPATDLHWVEECKRGSLGAFEQLYQQHGSRLKSIAYNLLGNRSDAEDAVQEAFLKVYRSIGSFQGQSAFSTWIYRILVNTCLDIQRGRKRRAEEPDTLPRGQSSSVALRIALERALGALNPKHRLVFLLAEVEGLKHNEIAGILDIPEGTSKSWLFEAKRTLQRSLSSPRRL